MISSVFVRTTAVVGMLVAFQAESACAWDTVRAHPQNPYIMQFRGQPTLLRTYGPSYESVFDSSLDSTPFMDVFRRDGMNLTRVWGIGYPAGNPQNFIQPWPRSTTSGNAMDGLGKWDFSAWDEAYFDRVKAFVQAASDRGIVVEFTFFSTFYEDAEWQGSPFHPSNNVQGYGSAADRFECMRPTDPNLLEAQKAAVRRIVNVLNGFDNVYYEVQNEPFWNDPNVMDAQEVDFQNQMLAAIRAEEAGLPNRHLVAHNFPQYSATMSSDFDMINEHYPAAVQGTTIAGAAALLANQYSRGKILSFDETDTVTEEQTRLEAWMFFIGGGGIYDGLDAEGAVYKTSDPSGDNTLGNAIRGAVRNSNSYMNGMQLVALRRNTAWVSSSSVPTGATLQASANPGQQYVAYLHHGKNTVAPYLHYDPIDSSNHNLALRVTLDAGTWRAVWTKPSDLTELHVQEFTHTGGSITLDQVAYQADIAVRIDRTGAEDTTPPPWPAMVGAESNADGSISLAWGAVQAFDLAGYQVYRSDSPGVSLDAAHLIAVLPATDTGFKDVTAVFQTTYYYVVTAIDQNGNESSASSETGSPSLLPHPDMRIYGDGNGQLILEWTTAFSGWYLQESPDLAPGSWVYSSLMPVVVGGNYQVTITPGPQSRFFRLINQAPPQVLLGVSINGDGQIVLAWPTSAAGWHLQESPDLTPGSWTDSALTPTVVGDQYQITIDPTEPQRFFRLAYP